MVTLGPNCRKWGSPVKTAGTSGDGWLLVEASLTRSSNLTVVVVPSSKEMVYSFDGGDAEGKVSAVV